MADTTPPPPKSGGSGPFIIAAVVMLLIMGGLIFWKMGGSEPAKTDAPMAATTPTPQGLDEPPPPPPPPPVEEDAGKPEEKQKAKVGGGGNPCAKECTGTPTGALQSALSGRAAQSRGCYETALRNNATLEGTLVVRVKVGPNGQVCSARASNDGLHDPGVTNCVINKFSSATLPAPEGGGCAEVDVPMRFQAKR
jgi:hypothetical protein